MMENNIYVGERNNIYAGRLVKIKKDTNELLTCRKMLLAVNSQYTNDDFLYCSPDYEIEKLKPRIETVPSFIITPIINLEEALCCLDFPKNLTIEDIRTIYGLFLSCNNQIVHSQLYRRTNLPSEIMSQLKFLCTLPKKPSTYEPDYKTIKPRIHVLNK